MAYREGAAGLLSENQRIRGLISSVIDIVLLIAAYLLANFLRFNWLPFFEEGGAGPALDIARSPMVALGWAGYAVVMVLLYWSRGLYNPSRLRSATRWAWWALWRCSSFSACKTSPAGSCCCCTGSAPAF